jgi:hypothetical protein
MATVQDFEKHAEATKGVWVPSQIRAAALEAFPDKADRDKYYEWIVTKERAGMRATPPPPTPSSEIMELLLKTNFLDMTATK